MQLSSIDLQKAKTLAKQHNYFEFLHKLGNPCYILLPGKNNHHKTVVITTLLHGNESSGIIAIHNLLRKDFQPDSNVVFIIASVAAALTEPPFTHRMLPGQLDLNRCFCLGTTDKSRQHILAKAIINCILQWQPEFVIDIHNTSGNGPAFAVATKSSDAIKTLASYFCERLIITDINLGALMEVEFNCPTITYEAGGANDSQSHYHAEQGIINLTAGKNQRHPTQDLLIHPRRVMLTAQSTLIYANETIPDVDLCLRSDIEHFNFKIITAGTRLGWSSMDVTDLLFTDKETISCADYFIIEGGILSTRKKLLLFMITTRADIAKGDCLFYFVERE